MLTIVKTENQAEIAAYCEKHKLTAPTLPSQFMGIFDGAALCGLGAITLEETKVYLDFMHAEDSSLLHGLGKSLFNMADLRGISHIYGKNKDLETLYISLRFKSFGGEFSLSLEGYFTKSEHC